MKLDHFVVNVDEKYQKSKKIIDYIRNPELKQQDFEEYGITPPSTFLFYGPPGCGKTTLARLIAKETDSEFIELSAVNSGIKDIKETVEKAKENLRVGRKTIVFIDEIHRYNKTQQDALLPHLENGTLFLIGSTTENPSFQVIPALISRTQVLRLTPLDDEAMLKIIRRGFRYLMDKYGKIELDKEFGEFMKNFK